MNEFEKYPLKIRTSNVLAKLGLNGNEKVVLLSLFMHHKRNYAKRITRISESKFEKDAAIEWELLSKILLGLEKKGWIDIEGKGEYRKYSLNYQLLEQQGLIQMKR